MDQLVRPQPKPTREINEARLDFARQMPCLISEYGTNAASEEHRKVCDWLRASIEERRSEAHHIRKGANSGLRTKPTDFRTVSLCETAHHEHDNGLGHDRFWAKYEIDPFQHIHRINIEFARFWRPRAQQERRILVPRLKRIIVDCPCVEQEHIIPGSKVSLDRGRLRFVCIRTNETRFIRMAG